MAFRLLISLLCFAGAFCARAEYVHNEYVTTLYDTLIRRVPAGTTVETVGTGVSGYINKNGKETESGPYTNSMPCIIIEDGATLKYTSGSSVWPMILVTNGCHATIWMANGDSPGFARSVIVEDGADLVIKGTTAADFGHNGYSWDGSNRRFYDVKNVRFGDGSVNGFTFHCAHIIRMPINWNGALYGRHRSTTEGTKKFTYREVANYCMLVGANAYEGWTVPPRVPSMGVYLHNPTAFGSSCTIPAGCEVILKQVKIPELTNEYIVQHCTDNPSFPTISGTTYDVDFELEDSTSMLTFGDGIYMGNIYDDGVLVTTNTASCGVTADGSVYVGRLTGNGKVTLLTEAGTTAKMGVAGFAGDASLFTGSFNSYNVGKQSAAGPFANLVISNDIASATAFAGEKAEVTFAAQSVPATRHVSVLAGGTMAAESGVTVDASSVAGVVTPTGAGAFEIQSMGNAGGVVIDDGVTAIRYGGAAAPTDTLVAPSHASPGATAYVARVNGKLDVSAAETSLREFPHLYLGVPDGGTVVETSSATKLSLGEGKSATVDATAGDVTASLAGAGTFTLAEPAPAVFPSWQENAALWFDFSVTNDLRYMGYARPDLTGQVKTSYERCFDKRGGEELYPYTLWNRRCYLANRIEGVSTVLPTWTTESALAGGKLGYLDFASGSRFPLSDVQASDGTPHLPHYSARFGVKSSLVVMVFGADDSHKGGAAIVGTLEGTFGRGCDKTNPTATTPITTNANARIWINGEIVASPATTPLLDVARGWHVVSVDMTGSSFSGIAFNQEHTSTAYTRGGQKYAEVIVFTNELSAAEFEILRLETEASLAEKWGFTGYDCAKARAEAAEQRQVIAAHELTTLTNTVTAIGSGTVVAGTHTLKLGGSFAGTVDLQGGNLFLDGGLPYAEEDVAEISADSRVFWMDPDDSETVTKVRWNDPNNGGDGGTNTVRTIVDKANGVAHRYAMQGRSYLMPNLWNLARGFGPERGWLDFNHNPAYELHAGAMLRLFTVPEDFDPAADPEQKAVEPVSVQTAFIVQDSLRGGGNPLAEALNGNGTIGLRATGSLTDPIWPRSNNFSTGVTKLDGSVVDQANGFSGKPEVLSVRGTGPITSTATDFSWTWTIGHYINSRKPNDSGEVIGEVLLYSNALSDVQMAGIESYLMQKWLGFLPLGFADARNVTITGSGTVTLESFGNLPKTDGDFSGRVIITDPAQTIEMTAQAATRDAVSCALVFPGATLERPAGAYAIEAFLDTRKISRKTLHRYTLLDVAALSDGVSFTAALAGDNWPADARIERNAAGTKIEVFVPALAHGLMIIYK